jgi:hypothetical protein
MMPLWLLEPVAAREDGWWQERAIYRLVMVAAPSAAQARLAAEHWAGVRPEMSNDNLNAGFADEKLYIARPAPEELHTGLEETRVVLAVAATWPTTR